MIYAVKMNLLPARFGLARVDGGQDAAGPWVLTTEAAAIAAEADATIAQLVEALELVARAGRGTSGRLILERHEEDIVLTAIASAKAAKWEA